jgi:hypothetical protein
MAGSRKRSVPVGTLQTTSKYGKYDITFSFMSRNSRDIGSAARIFRKILFFFE